MTVTFSATTLLWALVFGLGIAFAVFARNAGKETVRITAGLLETNEKISAMNIRLVDLETEPSEPVSKKDDDIMAAANSWLSQAAAAERGEGVRS